MRVVVKEGSRRVFHLRLPTGLMLNPVSAGVISIKLRETDVKISGKQLYVLFRAIKRYKKKHPEWKLVEVESRSGEAVEVVI